MTNQFKNTSYRILVTLALLLVTISIATAQTKVQRGIVRKQTFYPNDKSVPVQGVRFVVTGAADVSATSSDANGRFSLKVKDNINHKFSLDAVRPNKYGLLSPKKGEAIGLHPSDIIYVVVYTPEEKAAFLKKERDELKRKSREQMLKIKKLRDERDESLLLLSKSDVQYAKVTAERDSLQKLFTYYIENSEKIDKIVDQITEELAQADYQSLDSIDRKIYELKCTGEWKKISDLINEHMNSNAAAALESIQAKQRKAKKIEKQKKMELAAAMKEGKEVDNELSKWCTYMEDNIESLKMQHLNDSVSHCYALLVKADSTNWNYLNQAGQWEYTYMARYKIAMKYYSKALAYTVKDTLKATSYNNMGLVCNDQGDYAKALEYCQKALDLWRSTLGEQHYYVATSYNNLGLIYCSQGDYTSAEEYFQKALKIRLAIFGERHPDAANSYNNLGGVMYCQGDYVHAEDFHQKALKIRLAAFGEQHSAVAFSYNNLGMAYHSLGDYARAKEYFLKALKIRLAIFGDLHPDVARSYNNLGSVIEIQGDNVHAEEFYQKALKIQLSVLGEQHSDVATSYNNLGLLNNNQGNYARAEEYLQKALTIRLVVLGAQHPDVAISYNNLGLLNNNQGNYARAEECFQKALKTQLSVLGEQHPNVATSYNNLGYIYSIQGDCTHAEEYYQKALKIQLAVFGELHPDVAISYNNLGLLNSNQGDYIHAKQYYQKALEIAKVVLGENNPQTKLFKKNLDTVKNKN